jgi:hypothetical protein
VTGSGRQHPGHAQEAAVTLLTADCAITEHARSVSHGGLCAMRAMLDEGRPSVPLAHWARLVPAPAVAMTLALTLSTGVSV